MTKGEIYLLGLALFAAVMNILVVIKLLSLGIGSRALY